jgi:RNA polymerase sigma factor (sigma-70 family)
VPEAQVPIVTATRNSLVLANLGLVGWAVRRLHGWQLRRLGGRDDAFQAGVVALLRAAGHWDASRGVKFSVYATCAVRNHLLREALAAGPVRLPADALPGRCRYPRDVARALSVRQLDEDRADRLAAPPGPEPPDPAALARLAGALRALPWRQREAVRLWYLEGLTTVEIGERLGCSRSGASWLVRRGVKRLGEWLGGGAG